MMVQMPIRLRLIDLSEFTQHCLHDRQIWRQVIRDYNQTMLLA